MMSQDADPTLFPGFSLLMRVSALFFFHSPQMSAAVLLAADMGLVRIFFTGLFLDTRRTTFVKFVLSPFSLQSFLKIFLFFDYRSVLPVFFLLINEFLFFYGSNP